MYIDSNGVIEYEVGDRVTVVREALVHGRRYPTGYKSYELDWNRDMNEYCGKTITISRTVGHGRYRAEEDKGYWIWCNAFFENNTFVACNDDNEEMTPPNLSRLLGSFRVRS